MELNMISKKLMSKMVAATVLSLGMVTSALAVTCPSANEITGASDSLNGVLRQSPKVYFVLSAGPALNSNDMDWMLVTQTSAKGFDAAYTTGQKSVESVVAGVNEDAVEQGGMLICGYLTTSGGMNVMAVAQAPQDDGLFFNPAKINMDAIKAKK
jgi:hypothetical protein